MLIQVGDILDRGEDEIAIMSLLRSLDKQAKAKGGAVFQVCLFVALKLKMAMVIVIQSLQTYKALKILSSITEFLRQNRQGDDNSLLITVQFPLSLL